MANEKKEVHVVMNDAWAKGLTIKQTVDKVENEAGKHVSRRYVKNTFGHLNSTFHQFCKLRAERKMAKYL